MSCERPMCRIESTNGKVTFEQPELKDRQDLILNWHQKLENSPYIKSVKMFPCGKCLGCRLDYAKEWANRIVLEQQTTKNNYFLTITYNDENLPKKQCIDENGNVTGLNNTLVKKDLQDFIKRLRRRYEYKYNIDNIRYYCCGEYGDRTERAHYHGIFFNLPIWDLKKLKISPSGEQLYSSEELEKLWGKGYVVIGEVSWNSASYVARYVMKKRYGKDAEKYYQSKGKEPEFCTMSTHPALGYKYYQLHKEDIYENDEIWIPCKGKATRITPPKYFDDLYEIENPVKMQKIKDKRVKNQIDKTRFEMSKYNVVDQIQNQREVKARVLQAKSSQLKREM